MRSLSTQPVTATIMLKRVGASRSGRSQQPCARIPSTSLLALAEARQGARCAAIVFILGAFSLSEHHFSPVSLLERAWQSGPSSRDDLFGRQLLTRKPGGSGSARARG